jgi:arabinose-5-phosphate isomerase
MEIIKVPSGMNKTVNDQQEAKQVFEIEAQAILALRDRLQNFPAAVEVLFNCSGKVIVTGMGKSGAIGHKITATLSSTGTPSVFLHPAESSHGDMGMITSQDAILALSYGGESEELNAILAFAARKGIPVVALTGVMSSTLAKAAQVTLDISVKEEACPLKLAPTASSTATLAMGDALAIALLKRRSFTERDFAEFHPGGKLGRRLLYRVIDLMHSGESLPIVQETDELRKVLTVMTAKEVRGVAGVVSSEGHLLGVITDGDIRRLLEKDAEPLSHMASDVMNLHPKTVDVQELAEKALFMMEQFSIQTLFVVDRSSSDPKKPVGILHLQDILKAKIR